MSVSPSSSNPSVGAREPLPLSALNHYLFCARRAALIHIEGVFEANEHTLRGDIVHERTDLAGYEVAKGVTLLRALPVFSERLGLNGRCDIVEVRPAPSVSSGGQSADRSSQLESQPSIANSRSTPGEPPSVSLTPDSVLSLPSPLSSLLPGGTLYPVEFKLGKRRPWENDDVQLCAQALCLEEMFGTQVPAGAIYHASSRRRREVAFTSELRSTTEETVEAVRALFQTGMTPPAVFKSACTSCSLYDLCLPQLTSAPDRLQAAARALYRP